jgi:hypothetical protein
VAPAASYSASFAWACVSSNVGTVEEMLVASTAVPLVLELVVELDVESDAVSVPVEQAPSVTSSSVAPVAARRRRRVGRFMGGSWWWG